MSLYLPHVKNVAVPAINIIAVQNQIAVASIEVSMHFRFHLHHLQILNAPHLRMEKSLEMTLTDDFFHAFSFLYIFCQLLQCYLNYLYVYITSWLHNS